MRSGEQCCFKRRGYPQNRHCHTKAFASLGHRRPKTIIFYCSQEHVSSGAAVVLVASLTVVREAGNTAKHTPVTYIRTWTEHTYVFISNKLVFVISVARENTTNCSTTEPQGASLRTDVTVCVCQTPQRPRSR